MLSRAVLGGWGQVETHQLGVGAVETVWAGSGGGSVVGGGGGGGEGGGVTAAAVVSSKWASVTPTVHCLYGW